jgi:DNA-binding CsgD family transcriptional regulator
MNSLEIVEDLYRSFEGFIEYPQEISRKKHRPLSPREQELFKLMIAGKSNKEIALLMGLKKQTVITYTRSILKKMRVRRKQQAIDLADEALATLND